MKNYSKFEYAQRKVGFLAELDERMASQLDWWTEQGKRNAESLKEDDCDYYRRELATCEAAIDAINDIRALLEKQI